MNVSFWGLIPSDYNAENLNPGQIHFYEKKTDSGCIRFFGSGLITIKY